MTIYYKVVHRADKKDNDITDCYIPGNTKGKNRLFKGKMEV